MMRIGLLCCAVLALLGCRYVIVCPDPIVRTEAVQGACVAEPPPEWVPVSMHDPIDMDIVIDLIVDHLMAGVNGQIMLETKIEIWRMLDEAGIRPTRDIIGCFDLKQTGKLDSNIQRQKAWIEHTWLFCGPAELTHASEGDPQTDR